MLSVTGWLLLGLLALPTLGAIAARLIGRWAGSRAVTLVATLGVAGAVACLLALRAMPQAAAAEQLGVFLPSNAIVVPRAAYINVPTAAPAVAVAPPSATPLSIATPRPTPTATPSTATPTITRTAPPTEAPAPTEAPPPTAEARTSPRRYVIESGDTLRSIANRFDVSVEALLRYNGLTPEEGDTLSVGQEIFIPPE